MGGFGNIYSSSGTPGTCTGKYFGSYGTGLRLQAQGTVVYAKPDLVHGASSKTLG